MSGGSTSYITELLSIFAIPLDKYCFSRYNSKVISEMR